MLWDSRTRLVLLRPPASYVTAYLFIQRQITLDYSEHSLETVLINHTHTHSFILSVIFLCRTLTDTEASIMDQISSNSLDTSVRFHAEF